MFAAASPRQPLSAVSSNLPRESTGKTPTKQLATSLFTAVAPAIIITNEVNESEVFHPVVAVDSAETTSAVAAPSSTTMTTTTTTTATTSVGVAPPTTSSLVPAPAVDVKAFRTPKAFVNTRSHRSGRVYESPSDSMAMMSPSTRALWGKNKKPVVPKHVVEEFRNNKRKATEDLESPSKRIRL